MAGEDGDGKWIMREAKHCEHATKNKNKATLYRIPSMPVRVNTVQTDRHHYPRSGNIPKTGGGQVLPHLCKQSYNLP